MIKANISSYGENWSFTTNE